MRNLLKLILKNMKFKRYNKDYLISEYGDVYSERTNRFLKPAHTASGHQRVDIYGKHTFIHRMVYQTWIGNVPNGLQINHRDDNKDNNHYSNLYAGTQKENIQDCVRNGNRQGNIKTLTVKDKKTGEILSFTPASKFYEYAGHSCKSGSVRKAFKRDWFKERYEVIEFKQGRVTTMDDECNPVGRILSPLEAHRTLIA